MAYVSKAELTEQAKTQGATDEQLSGLTRDEIEALIETLGTADESTTKGEDDDGATAEGVAEDTGVVEESTSDDAATDTSEETGGEESGEVADNESATSPVSEGTTESEGDDAVNTEKADESVVDEADASDGAGEGDAEPEASPVVDGDQPEEHQPSEDGGDSKADGSTVSGTEGDGALEAEDGVGPVEAPDVPEVTTTVDPDAEVEAAAGVDNTPEIKTNDGGTEHPGDSDEPASPLAREVKDSEFRDAMPTVFAIADEALARADYELTDDIVAAIACDLIGLCARARRAAAVIIAGVKLPRSFGGRMRFNATKRALHGMLGSFETNSRISAIVREISEVVASTDPLEVVKAVREVETYIGDEPRPEEDKTNTAEDAPVDAPVDQAGDAVETSESE